MKRLKADLKTIEVVRAENSDFTEGNKESEISIIREGDFSESTLDITEERNIFVGKENRMSFRQMYSKQFRCLFQLQLYPFDTQVIETFKIIPISSCKSS